MKKSKYKRILCADGFNMSVQASETSYCEPRNDRGPYKEVEIGFPSEREDLLMKYIVFLMKRLVFYKTYSFSDEQDNLVDEMIGLMPKPMIDAKIKD